MRSKDTAKRNMKALGVPLDGLYNQKMKAEKIGENPFIVDQ